MQELFTPEVYCRFCQRFYLVTSENFYFTERVTFDFKKVRIATCQGCHQRYYKQGKKGPIFRFYTDPTAGLSITFGEVTLTYDYLEKGLDLREIQVEINEKRREKGIPKTVSLPTIRAGLYRTAPMIDAYILTKCKPKLVIDDTLQIDDAPYTRKAHKLKAANNSEFYKIVKEPDIIWCCRAIGEESEAPYSFGISRNRYEASRMCAKRLQAYLGLELLKNCKFKTDEFFGHKKALMEIGIPTQNIKSAPKRVAGPELNLIESLHSLVNRLYTGKHAYITEASVFVGMIIATVSLTFWRPRTLHGGELKTRIADLLKLENRPKDWWELIDRAYWNVLGTPSLFKLYGRFRKRLKKPKY